MNVDYTQNQPLNKNKKQNKILSSEFINLNNHSPKKILKNKNEDNHSKKRNKITLLGYLNPIEEEYEKIAEELGLSKRHNIEIENNRLIYRTEDDIMTIQKIIKEDNILYYNEKNISFFDIICYILKKNSKRYIEIEILKIFFLKTEKLVALFKPLNININDMMGKLVGHIKYEKKLKNNILFKEGDKGDKFYIILKGEVGILIHQERIINCTPIEYLKCLMVLYLYQEKSLVNKSILANRGRLKFDDRCFSTLMDIFKFYQFYKEYPIIRRTYKDIIEFVRVEIKICKYLHKKNDFLPEESFRTLDLSNRLAEELYNFYYRILDNLKNCFLTDLPPINNDKIKESSFNSNINNPNNLSEFVSYIKQHEIDERKYKTDEFFEKLYYVNELSNNYIRSCNVNDYIQRLNGEEILKLVRKDAEDFFMKLYEDINIYKYYNYFEVNKLKEGNIFGELALINPSKKRTATVIIREDCHLGVLNKEAYDISIKNAQDKLRIRNLAFFTNGPIFNGVASNYFLNNYFFRFKKRVLNTGEVLFHRGEIRTKIYFIINGELQLSAKLTLKKLTEIINYLSDGRDSDDGGLSKKYCRESFQFKRFYEEVKKNFRLYVLKDREISGLDDMTENNIYLFDCSCVSLEPTEVYELEYKIFEEASEDKMVKRNNDEYVAMKKEFLLNRLYGQRDSIAKNEYNRIKAFFVNLNKKYLGNNEEKNNIIENNIKTLNNFFPLTNTTFNKKIFSYQEEAQNNINTSNYFNKKFPLLNTTRNLSSYGEIKNKSNQNKFLKTDGDETNSLFSKKNIMKPIKLKNSDKIQKEKSLILMQMNKEKSVQNSTNINILNYNNINMTRIASYINNNKKKNNDLSISKKSHKLIRALPSNISNSKLKKLRKNVTPTSNMLMKEFTKRYIEPNKTPYAKRRFIFDNQKIFEPLLNDKSANDKKLINITLESGIESLRKNEFNKESFIKEKNKLYNNNSTDFEIENSEPSNRMKNYNYSSVRNKILNKYMDNKMEEKYKDIFFIDCLCLDKWEEKKNKYQGKKKAKLKGKKILK